MGIREIALGIRFVSPLMPVPVLRSDDTVADGACVQRSKSNQINARAIIKT
jgi:hypothetical protein